MTEPTNKELLAVIQADAKARAEYQQNSVAWRTEHDKKHEKIEERIASLETTFEQGRGAAMVLLNLGKIVGVIAFITAAVWTVIKSAKGVG